MLKKVIGLLILLLIIVIVFMRLVYVEPSGFPDRSGAPLFQESALELVANLEQPPANIAVNKAGRIFVTLHPEARPVTNLGEIVEGLFSPWTNVTSDAYGIRFDSKGYLWILDNYPARLVAYDIDTKTKVHEYVFDSDAFPLLSHANDFQISPNGNFIYIADDGLFNRKPSLVVYDVINKNAWRHLENHSSVNAGEYSPVVQGVEMTKLGLFSINPGVDGIALSRDGQWLYYGSFSGDQLHRVPAESLHLESSNVINLVESVGLKTFTDGMTTDLEGRIYLSDIEHSAIVRLMPNEGLETLIKTDKLRWPDGFSFDNNGYLYVACSALHQVILKTSSSIEQKAPFQIYRLKVTDKSIAGH